MAQDDGSIYLYARDGLAFAFRIDAPDSYGAQFAPDSSAVVFYDQNYRVERWALASKQRESVHELVMNPACLQSSLSSDGRTMACATSDMELRVVDVASGEVIFRKGNIFTMDLGDALELYLRASQGPNPQYFQMRFSPDARSLVVARESSYVALDIAKRQVFSLPGAIRSRLGVSFAFIGNDRLVGIHPDNPDDSAIVTFPKGDLVTKLNLPYARVEAPTRSDAYLLVAQPGSIAVGMFSLKVNKLASGSPTPALDILDDSSVYELRNGEIALGRVDTTAPVRVAQVPAGPLGRLRAADISPDFRFAALSQASRGVIWDLETGKSLQVRGFHGALADAEHRAFMDFPREGKSPRAVVRVDSSLKGNQGVVVIEEPRPANAPPQKSASEPNAIKGAARITATQVRQHGAFLIGFLEGAKKSDGPTLVVYDAVTGRELWKRPLGRRSGGALTAEAPHNCLVLIWNYDSDAAKAVAETNAAVRLRFDAMKANKNEVGLIEIIDLDSGRVRGDLLVNFGRGSFRADKVIAEGDRVIIGDDENRTLAYSLASGKPLGRAFGSPLDVSPGAGQVCVQNGAGEVAIYSVADMQKVDEFVFPSAVAFARFSPDGKRLFVLTKDQTAYTIDLAASKSGAH